MAVHAGRHRLGPDRGRIILRTFRDGVAARAGHDLTIEVARWSGELRVSDDLNPSALDVRADMTSLTVLEGHGGLARLTGRDRREIAVTARKVLGADRYPEARFEAATFEPAPASGVIGGTPMLHGESHPLRLEVHENDDGRCHASGCVTQSDYGIKPYTEFLGALRVRDAVDIDVDVGVPQNEDGAGGAP